MNILLKAAKIIDSSSPFHQQKKDILIKDGQIIKIAESITNTVDDTREIQLKNLHVSCGWVDSSVSFGEPGFEEREHIENGLKTAAKSGFTEVLVNPNTQPAADNKSAIEFIKNKSEHAVCKLHPIGNLTKNGESKDVAELFDMKNSGAIAFGDYKTSISNANLLKIALQYAQNFDGLVLSFPNDQSIAGTGLVNEDVNSTKLGLSGIAPLAEEMQIARDLFLLTYTGGKLHIPTISTSNAVKLIKEAKKKGLEVSCSVSAHHLTLTDDELRGFDANTKVLPPLRTKRDNKALIKGLSDGTIDMITSDHDPIDVEHKKVEYQNAMFGTIGLESLFGALSKVIDLEILIKKLTQGPRDVFGLTPVSICENQTANLTLFNPDRPYEFTNEHIHSTSKNSIFLGKHLNGEVYGTIFGKRTTL